MISRRNFVKNIAASVAAIYAANGLTACDSLFSKKLGNIGYITGILGRDLAERDWKTILETTAEYGYSEIETGNYLGESAESFLAFLKEIGLKTIAGGTRWTDDMDQFRESLDKLNALEMKYAIAYWPWFVGPPFNLEECKRSAETLNKMGEAAKNQGLTFCWHNHDHEFKPMEEGLPFDYLMNNTDPDLVKCELDVYWARKGDVHPVQVMQQYRGRFPILHVKDMAPGEEQDFACPGEGILNWEAIFTESLDQGIKHYFVERDGAVDGLGCLKSSAEFLKSLRV